MVRTAYETANIPPERQGRSRTGFTLVELLVVIAIVGILASSVLFGIHMMTTDARMRSSSLTVITALRAARSRAMADGKVCAVRFSKDTDDTGSAFFTRVRVYRFDAICDVMKYERETELWQAVDEGGIDHADYTIIRDQYLQKDIFTIHDSLSDPGENRPPMLFFSDGSTNDTWGLTVYGLDNWDPDTQTFARPREVFRARISMITGLPVEMRKLKDGENG